MATQLSTNFTLEELTHSATADRYKIANTPTAVHLANIERYLVPGLELSRVVCGNLPIRVHDAYRNPRVNELVGGTATSAHPLGFAADIDVAGQTPAETARRIAAAMKHGILQGKIDQLIFESGRNTVHLSFDPRARGMMGRQPRGPGTPIDWTYFQ